MHGDDDVDELEAGERHPEDGVDPGGGVPCHGVLGDRQHHDRDAEAALAKLGNDLLALRASLEEPVDDDDVRAQLARLGRGAPAVVDDVDELDLRLRVQQAAHVLGDLGHVLDEEEADRDCSRRTSGRRYHAQSRLAGARHSGDHDRPIVMGSQGLEVVAAGDQLHLQAGRLGHRPELVGRHEAHDVPPDPAAGGLTGIALIVDRREGDGLGGGVVLGGRRLGHPPPGLGVGAVVLQVEAAVVAGQVVGVGEPGVHGGHPAGGEVRRRAPPTRPAGRPGWGGGGSSSGR